MKSVYVVSHMGVYAICTSREKAYRAKRILKDRKAKIKQIVLDTVYPFTVANHDKILQCDLEPFTWKNGLKGGGDENDRGS